ncbi:hypothetical protein GQ44DRAFT_719819 [Phaeosphaeriaceae sp. PMI808]|nr:hypothetical protein GQ44DRAFT_719819 [Phaeosphaeriaceae sp. PMI808]
MWTDLQSDLQPLGDVRMIDMQRKIEEMVRECTDGFFLQCQRSFLSPPPTPRPSEPLGRIPSSPLRSDTLSEESGMSNRLTAPAAAVHASPTHTANFESNSDATFSGRDRSGYVQPPAPTAFTACTASPSIPPAPDTNGRFGFSNQGMWDAPYLAPPGRLMGQYGALGGGDDGANVDYDEIMYSLGPMNSGQWNQFPGSGCI